MTGYVWSGGPEQGERVRYAGAEPSWQGYVGTVDGPSCTYGATVAWDSGLRFYAATADLEPAREQCAPNVADWYVEVIYGRTFCECEGRCPSGVAGEHERAYGTETDYNYGYYQGERPAGPELYSLVPEGFHRLEFTIKPCKR